MIETDLAAMHRIIQKTEPGLVAQAENETR
jgi:hypothetical protein